MTHPEPPTTPAPARPQNGGARFCEACGENLTGRQLRFCANCSKSPGRPKGSGNGKRSHGPATVFGLPQREHTPGYELRVQAMRRDHPAYPGRQEQGK